MCDGLPPSLPDEVLEHIFSFLDVTQRLSASLVSKRWLQILSCNKLLIDVVVKISNNDMEEAMSIFNSMSRPFNSFYFEHINGNWVVDAIAFLKRFSGQMHTLHFSDCNFGLPSSSRQYIETLKNLKVLKVFNSDVIYVLGSFPNLHEFHIECMKLTDFDLKKLDDTMKHLRSFQILAQIACDPKAYKRFYRTNPNEEYLSELILSFPAVENFIKKRAKTLTHLYINNILPVALKQLFSIKNLKLYCFKSSTITRDAIKSLVQCQPDIKNLELSNILDNHDAFVKDIATALPLLTEISIKYNWCLNTNMKYIFQLKDLRKLDLRGCSKISPSTYKLTFSVMKAHNLSYLSLSGTSIDSESINLLIPKVCKLEYLDLSVCKVLDENVQMISFHLKMLKYLNLRYCKDITDDGLLGKDCSISNLTGLVELNLYGLNKITDKGIIEGISFKNLKVLDLLSCNLITPCAVNILRKQNPSLKRVFYELQLENCKWNLHLLLNTF